MAGNNQTANPADREMASKGRFQSGASRASRDRTTGNAHTSFRGTGKGGSAMKLPNTGAEPNAVATASGNGHGKPTFERLGECLYRKGTTIYARVRVNGKLTWKSTETNEPAKARKWLAKWRNEEWMVKNGFELQGVALHRQRVTV